MPDPVHRTLRRGYERLAARVSKMVIAGPILVTLMGCTVYPALPARPTSPTSGATASPDSGTATSAMDADWVKAENAKPGNADWRIPPTRVPNDHELAGYADHTSVLSGDAVGLYITSTLGAYTVAAYRVGDYGGLGGRLVWGSGTIPGKGQPREALTAEHMVTTTWSPSTSVSTAGWPAGLYLFKVSAASADTYIPLTVRHPESAGRVVIVDSVATREAYNQWGGYSLYRGPDMAYADRSRVVSFDRPYDNNGVGDGSSSMNDQVRYLESLGLNLGYVTSTDLDADSAVLDGAAAVVSLAHDEYYSVAMRANLERAIGAGTNLAYLGGNGVYWRVRFGSSSLGPARVMIGYREIAEDPLKDAPQTTTMWRSGPNARPESSLLGVQYACIAGQAPLVVLDPGFWAWAGTGVSAGSTIPGLIGQEVDTISAASPVGLQVVGHSPITCRGGGKVYADTTYYTTLGGAGVFAAGSISWTRAWAGTNATWGVTAETVAFARQVAQNILTAFSQPRAGTRLPARGNLRELGHGPGA
jgi:hypothetical protein